MFDAKKLLDQIIAGGSQQHRQPAGGGLGGLGDLLGQLAGGAGGNQAGQSSGSNDNLGGLGDLLGKLGAEQSGGKDGKNSGGGDLGGLGDLLRQFTGDSDKGAGGASSGQTGSGAGSTDADGGLGAGLGDILGKLQQQQAGQQSTGQSTGEGSRSGAGGGNIMDILGNILGQATDGVKEGAGRISDATGAGDALEKVTGGRSADDLMAQLKDLIANNKLGAGVAAGGLGALVLGTQTGRDLAASVAKLGGLALIGGLAYKAYQNYQAGKPLIDTTKKDTEAAPDGSGFEPRAITNDSALTYIRAMIAAAAADGRIDESEQEKIFGSLQQAGFDDSAREFLRQEFANPATVEALADAVTSDEEGVQVFTAARMAIDFDNIEEQQFLMALAGELDLPPELIQHIDAAARGNSPSA